MDTLQMEAVKADWHIEAACQAAQAAEKEQTTVKIVEAGQAAVALALLRRA